MTFYLFTLFVYAILFFSTNSAINLTYHFVNFRKITQVPLKMYKSTNIVSLFMHMNTAENVRNKIIIVYSCVKLFYPNCVFIHRHACTSLEIFIFVLNMIPLVYKYKFVCGVV